MDKFEKEISGEVDAILYSMEWYITNGTNPHPNSIKEDLKRAKILLAGLRKYQVMKKRIRMENRK